MSHEIAAESAEQASEALLQRIRPTRPGSSALTSNTGIMRQGSSRPLRGEADGRLVQCIRRREVDWPAFASPRREPGEKREADDEAADRVRYLFPVPDATDWDVGELRYEREHPS